MISDLEDEIETNDESNKSTEESDHAYCREEYVDKEDSLHPKESIPSRFFLILEGIPCSEAEIDEYSSNQDQEKYSYTSEWTIYF